MNIDRVSATAFMTKDIHIAFEQPRSERIVVPQAIIVGSVTHWKPAYTKELNIALGIFPKPVLVKSEARTVNRLLSLLKMPIAYMLIAVTRIGIHYRTWMERVENNFCNIKKLWYNNYEREMKEL